MPTGIYPRTEIHLRNLTSRFKEGHPFYAGGEKGWFKKGEAHSKYWLRKNRPNLWNGSREKLKGKHFSPATEFKKGIHYSPETEITIEKRKHMILPLNDTSIEVKVQNFLKRLNIDFFTHQYIKEIEHGYQCDILIPSINVVIECDGNFWHKYPTGRELDHIRTKELIDKGFKVLRLWESEIRKMTIDDFKNRLILYK